MGNAFWTAVLGSDLRTEARISMLGLDTAGKTTILYQLKLGEVVATTSTIGFNVETVKAGKITMEIWDFPGQDQIRPLWRGYFANTHGLIYVVDSNDRKRMGEAAEELHKMLMDCHLQCVALLVFCNKQDLPDAMNLSEIADRLGLYSLKGRNWNMQSTCAITGEGIHEGLNWLAETLNRQF